MFFQTVRFRWACQIPHLRRFWFRSGTQCGLVGHPAQGSMCNVRCFSAHHVCHERAVLRVIVAFLFPVEPFSRSWGPGVIMSMRKSSLIETTTHWCYKCTWNCFLALVQTKSLLLSTDFICHWIKMRTPRNMAGMITHLHVRYWSYTVNTII